jgi:hypothetical protein
MTTVCAVCGKTEEEHHAWDPVRRPTGCRCSVTDWRDRRDIPTVCEKYEGDGNDYCKRCEHDRKCHAA